MHWGWREELASLVAVVRRSRAGSWVPTWMSTDLQSCQVLKAKRELRSLWAEGQKEQDLICFECLSVANGMVVVITKET